MVEVGNSVEITECAWDTFLAQDGWNKLHERIVLEHEHFELGPEQGSEKTQVAVEISWKTGFYVAVQAFESGQIKLLPDGKPENN